MDNIFKFRAWHKTAKDMLYEDNIGDVFRWLNDGQPLVIEQCTGLKDKNGTLIFDGDLLLLNDTEIKPVIYKFGCFGVISKSPFMPHKDEFNPLIVWDEVEITGNIHNG